MFFFSHLNFTAKHSTMHKTFMKLALSRVLGGRTCEIFVLVACPLRRSYNIDMPSILIYSVLFLKILIQCMCSMQFLIFRDAFCTRKTTRPSASLPPLSLPDTLVLIGSEGSKQISYLMPIFQLPILCTTIVYNTWNIKNGSYPLKKKI